MIEPVSVSHECYSYFHPFCVAGERLEKTGELDKVTYLALVLESGHPNYTDYLSSVPDSVLSF